jgi:chaperonin GroEL (HSP60 family)
LRIGDEVGRDIAAIELHPFLFAKYAGTEIKIDDELEGDQKVGVEILKRALDEPLRQLVANAGLEGSVVVEEIRRQNRPNYGFHVLREQYVDLVEAGIIDPYSCSDRRTT